MKKSFRKRPISILLSLLLIVQAVGALFTINAAAETYNGAAGELTWTWEDGVLTLSGTGSTGDWEAGSSGVAVERPWEDLRNVTTAIVAEEGVTEIGKLAFFGFSNLTSVSLPSTLAKIQKLAFARCFALMELEIPAAVTVVGREAFVMSGIQKITALGSSPTTISTASGTHPCDGLTYTLYTPYNTATWSETRLGQMGGTPTQIRYAAGSCGTNAAWRLEGDTLTISGTGATTSYTNTVNAPWKTYAANITRLVVEEGITELANYTFNDMTALTEVDLAYTVNRINTRAFNGCTSLTALKIWGIGSGGLAGYQAFVGTGITDLWYLSGAPATISGTKPCEGLTYNIHVPAGDTSWTEAKVTGMGGTATLVEEDCMGSCGTAARWLFENGTLTIKGSGSTTGYTNAKNYPWKDLADSITALVVGENITELGNHTCYQLVNLSSVTLSSTVNRIQTRCFNGCTSLTTLRVRGSGTGGLAGYAAFVDSGVTDLWYDNGAPATISGTAPCSGLTYTIHVPEGDATWTATKLTAMGGTPTLSETRTELPVHLPFYGYSLSLAENLQINFYVEKDLIVDQGMTDLTASFSFDGNDTAATEWETITSDGRTLYRAVFKDIAPYKMNEAVTATLSARKDGEIKTGETVSSSVTGYCEEQLAQTSSDTLRTLLVDLLNYGSATQTYVSYDTEHLANASLTPEQSAWGTAEDPDLASYLDLTAETVDSPQVTWKGASLYLSDAITMRVYFTLDDITDATLVVEDLTGAECAAIPASSFVEAGEFGYAVTFRNINADQLRDLFRFTVKRGDAAISNTLQYSVESYAYAKRNSSDPNLSALCRAILRYGDAASAYSGHTAPALRQALTIAESLAGHSFSQEELTRFFPSVTRTGSSD